MPVGRGFTAARQQASRLAQGAVPLDPGLRAMRAGAYGDMPVGRGFTAARQRASRLAGLVQLRVS